MSETRRRFSRQTLDQRQDALIQATLALISRGGPEAATVRSIAQEAGVTQGLIRHYFSTKEELVRAAYEHHMNAMTDATAAVLDREFPNAAARLAAFVISSLTPPVVDPKAMALWAGFIHTVQRDAGMRATHEKTYYSFRDGLQMLIQEALSEAGHAADETTLRRYAIACNAVIDGLWMEGGALPDSFETDELSDVGMQSISSILGLDLMHFRDCLTLKET